MTIGDCADAGPTRARAATDAAAKISLRMLPPIALFGSAPRAAPMVVCQGSITEKRRELPLPLSRGAAGSYAATQNAAPKRRVFPYRRRPCVLLRQARLARSKGLESALSWRRPPACRAGVS